MSDERQKSTGRDATQAPSIRESPKPGLSRMEGTSRLNLAGIDSPLSKKSKPTTKSSFLTHSASVSRISMSFNSTSGTVYLRKTSNKDSSLLSHQKPFPTSSGLTRTKTSAEPLNRQFLNDKKSYGMPLKIQHVEEMITPIRRETECTTGRTISKSTIVTKHQNVENIEAITEQDQVTPPAAIRRTSSGSMLLRQTPERIRRNVEETLSPTKRMSRSGSMPRLLTEDDYEHMDSNSNVTPVLKRKRTSSACVHPPDSMPVLTANRLRPRGVSESGNESPMKHLNLSPMKKRVRQDSGSRPNSSHQSPPILKTPIRKYKSTILNPKAINERISQTYGSVKTISSGLKHFHSTVNIAAPTLAKRSTSGDSYYSAIEGDEPTYKSEVFLTPSNSLHERSKMVPLVKKQVSVDEKTIEDEEDEGFGDSMRTIKKGQGSALARSLSLKLSPRKDEQKPIGADTEKSCSTPSLPTAPLVRQGSTSSLRFKVSPSTFLKPVTPFHATPTTAPSVSLLNVLKNDESSGGSSEPSTSQRAEEKRGFTAKKSVLKKESGRFTTKDVNVINVLRRRKIKFSGVNVHYFDRRQGDSTVPTEGEVSLDMHNDHHSHRYFSLASGKRPLLDLSLYEDEELSDGEVIDPDSDGDLEYDEYASTKSILRINQKHRIKLLKKSGIKVERSSESMEKLRTMRVDCGCSCENGVCLPETCQCAINGINCQVDGEDYPTQPCSCFAETCTNPEGRTFYDAKAVHEFRVRTMMNWHAAQKVGVTGSPTVKKFVNSDDEDDEKKRCHIKNTIPTKLDEESPARYPVTPIYTRRSRSSLSDIRESGSETSCTLASTTSLSDRLKAIHNLDNEVCVEEEDEGDKDETVVEPDLTLRVVYVAPESSIDVDEVISDSAMSPAKTTLAV